MIGKLTFGAAGLILLGAVCPMGAMYVLIELGQLDRRLAGWLRSQARAAVA